jgi:hypothetical protein
MLWSMVHGYAMLLIDGQIRPQRGRHADLQHGCDHAGLWLPPQLDFDRIPWCCTMTSSVCIGWWTLPRFVFNKRHRLGEDYLDLFLRQGRLQIQKLAS